MGSMLLQAPTVADTAHAEQCIAIMPQNVDLLIRGFTGSGGGSFTYSATAFDMTACTGTNLGSLTAGAINFGFPGYYFGVSQTWYELSNVNQPLPAGTLSVRIALDAVGGGASSSAAYYIDHARFGPTGTTPVMLQAFDVE